MSNINSPFSGTPVPRKPELKIGNDENQPVEEEINKVEEVNNENESKQSVLKKIENSISTKIDNASKPIKFLVFDFVSKAELTVFLAFIIPPLIISVISMIHIVSFFELTNNLFLSWMLSAAFEFASISALFALTALNKIKKNTIWILFFSIMSLQIVGNVYHSYIHINMNDVNLLKLLSILEIDASNLNWTVRIIGFLQGAILPVISLSFVKSITEYLSINRQPNNE